MEKFVRITGANIDKYLDKYKVLACSLRVSRNRSKQLAIWELFSALSAVDAIFITNGPLGEVAAQASFFIPKHYIIYLEDILKGMGYSKSFYILDFNADSSSKSKFSWKGREFVVNSFFSQDKEIYKQQSAHNRNFCIYDQHGEEKEVQGYRGDGSFTGKRGLAVEDCRLLVNIAEVGNIKTMLDPFAGTGGIPFQAKYINPDIKIITGDIDKVLEPGLRRLSDIHYTVDSTEFPLEHKVDAIITEVPFVEQLSEIIAKTFVHLYAALEEQGRLIFMCHEKQYLVIAENLEKQKYYNLFKYNVGRQGSEVVVSSWFKERDNVLEMLELSEEIAKIL